MQKIKDFLNGKALGFWFSASAAVLAVILFIAYLAGYAGSEYMAWEVPVLIILSVAAFAGLSVFDKTAPFAPAALLVLAFGGLCCYMCSIHVYVAASFPDGINLESMANLNPAFFITVILFLVIIILGHFGVYMKQNKNLGLKEAEA